jgi:hypothetical protein
MMIWNMERGCGRRREGLRVVCTGLSREGEAGRFITKVWTVGATTNAILQLGGPVQVVAALSLLGLLPDLLHLLAERLHPAQGLPFGLPLGAQRVRLRPQVRQFLAQVSQAGLTRLILLLGQSGLSEETEARLPEIFGGSSVALARTLKIIEPGERRIQPAEWDRAFRIFDLLI